MDRLIQLWQRQELAVPQSRQNEGGDDTDGAFYRRLILGRADSGRKDRRAVMLRQLLIRLVENDLVLAMLLHTGFQVVALDDPGDAAEVFEGVHMGGGPGLLVHREEGLHIAVTAVGQRCHEHIVRDHFAGIRVNDGGGVTGPVHLHDLTGLVIQVHGGVCFGQIVGVVLVELGGLVRDLARRPALVAVFEPEQIQGDTAALELLVDIGIVRHLVDGLRGTGREQALRELLVRHLLRQRPLQAAVRRPLQHGCHGVPGALTACGDLSLVEPQAVEPEDLTVIGHVDNLLADIYAENTAHIYILPWCSTPAARLLNPAGRDAQSGRSRCAIRGGILSTPPAQEGCELLLLSRRILPDIFDLEQSLCSSPLGIVQQFPGIAGTVANIADQPVAGINHDPIGTHDCVPFWRAFQAVRVICPIKPVGSLCGAFSRMIRHTSIRVMSGYFCFMCLTAAAATRSNPPYPPT